MYMDEDCNCPIRPNMSFDELMDEILIPNKDCCSSLVNPAKGWICPTLDYELQRARKERRQSSYSSKVARERKKARAIELASQGYSKDEIVAKLRSEKKTRRKKSKNIRKIKKSRTNLRFA